MREGTWEERLEVTRETAAWQARGEDVDGGEETLQYSCGPGRGYRKGGLKGASGGPRRRQGQT